MELARVADPGSDPRTWIAARRGGVARGCLRRNDARSPLAHFGDGHVDSRPLPQIAGIDALRGDAGSGIPHQRIFFGPQFIEDERTGEVYLIEINHRVTNGIQLGGLVGVDVCGALAAALEGPRARGTHRYRGR